MTAPKPLPLVRVYYPDSRYNTVKGAHSERENTTEEVRASGERETSPSPSSPFPVVGIGASAGGLAAFEAFFSGMPADADPGMAFVLVQHLAPDHKSMLTDLIKRYTRMRVYEVEDGMTVHPNSAYIIPPGPRHVVYRRHLTAPRADSPRGHRLPIDFFFRSLAEDQKERAIAVVLSGTASDGAHGIRTVKGEGGMIMVQSPESTEYDGMPRSAIATGMVDFVLPPAEMAAALISYSSRAFGETAAEAKAPEKGKEKSLETILKLLRKHSGHDFSHYKPSTVSRRIKRRMALQQFDEIEKYEEYVHQKSEELDALFQDLLIGVTNFFRDAEAFAALEESIIPQLFAGKRSGDSLRVWSAGCSTGEEAYSIAILLHEYMETLHENYNLQVFATDIDDRAIAVARGGIYPASIAADMSPERLSRYFSEESVTSEGAPESYRIHKKIRDVMVFSKQDLIKDPPFSNLDLLSCRNLMIYLNPEVHKKLIPPVPLCPAAGGHAFFGYFGEHRRIHRSFPHARPHGQALSTRGERPRLLQDLRQLFAPMFPAEDAPRRKSSPEAAAKKRPCASGREDTPREACPRKRPGERTWETSSTSTAARGCSWSRLRGK